MNKKFIDGGYFSTSFMDSIWVYCPKCEKKAIIRHLKNHYGRYSYQNRENNPPEICCQHCGYIERQKIYYDLEVKRNCPTCDKFFLFTMEDLREKKTQLKISCPHCQQSEFYQPTYFSYYQNPFFGSKLWLQKPFRGHLFWAYNAEHLAYLKAFIAADMRQRNYKYNRFRTMISCLPNFIKVKKNREGLLKVITQLEEKIISG